VLPRLACKQSLVAGVGLSCHACDYGWLWWANLQYGHIACFCFCLLACLECCYIFTLPAVPTVLVVLLRHQQILATQSTRLWVALHCRNIY
jgi:hypothetical protein